MARDLSPVRDSQGRRTWLFEGFLEREGGAPPVGVPAAAPSKHIFPVRPAPGAWTLLSLPGDTRHALGTFSWIDADSGRELKVPQEHYQPLYVLPGARMLVQRSATGDLRDAIWTVVDLETSHAVPALGAPKGLPKTAWPVCQLEGDRILLCAKDGGAYGLWLWDPVSGSRERLTVGGLDSFAANPRVEGPNVEGWRILRLSLPGEPGESWVLLSPDGRTSRLIGRRLAEGGQPIYLAPDGSVLSIVDDQRIVRVGPEVGQVEVLFPKAKE